MPVDIGLSLLHPLLSVGTAAASRRSSGKGQAAAALLLPWIGGGAFFMSASQPRAPPPHHPPSAEGPRRPARHQRHQGPWFPWLWNRHRPCRWRPHLIMIVHNRRHTIGGHIVDVRKIALLLRLLRRTRGVAGQEHSVAVVAPEATSLSSGDGCFWGAAVSTYFGGVPRPLSMLSGSGTDARSKACSVDASETVLLHTPSPRHPTEPLETGCRWWRISCTPARGHGK
ncbi:hypothetical protein TcCL_Unassigned02984 [Trypanosoma cruzi]|nr:hypothetical protein TcCL_Unassigned02984 [Trypanosoma cruzi]